MTLKLRLNQQASRAHKQKLSEEIKKAEQELLVLKQEKKKLGNDPRTKSVGLFKVFFQDDFKVVFKILKA